MAPWPKTVYPPTVGPTEYCPPRHLGGEGVVWRELMRWSEAAAAAGRGVNTNNDKGEEDERKVNSLDEVEAAAEGLGSFSISLEESSEHERVGNSKSIGSGTFSFDVQHEEEKRGSNDELEQLQPPKNPASPSGGWRRLTSAELNTVQRLGDRNESGELTFQTYDLSHVTMDTARGITKDICVRLAKRTAAWPEDRH